ncbi:hypothetical protein As57867_017884, partial [Aphanomyces stellatus]
MPSPFPQGPRRPLDTSIDLAYVLRRKDPFRAGRQARYDMKAFVSALAPLNEAVVNEFVLLCARESHVKTKVTALLEYRFDPQEGTFAELAVPLLSVLTSSALAHSPYASDVRSLYRLVYSCPLFLKRVLDCLEEYPNPPAATDVASLLLVLAKKLPTQVPQDDDFYDAVCRCREWSRRVAAAPADQATLDEVVALCLETVPSRRSVVTSLSSAMLDYVVDTMNDSHRFRSTVFDEDNGFGRGPRHDNDAERIEEIQVLPTDDEMRCAETPFLPLRPPPTAGFDAHVAFHFRLMREDILAQMRRGLQWWLHPATDRTVSTAKHVVDGVPRLHVATGVSMSKLHGSIHKGLLFQLTVPQPWTGKSKGQLKILWERDARYSIGSLVCLATQVQMRSVKQTAKDDADAPFPRRAPMACDRLVFATVAARDPALLVANSATFAISVKLIKPHETIDVVRAMNQGLNVLLEVRNLFFTGYEPILRALQRREALSPRLASCLYGGDQ